jgi:hypothetical protein
MHASFAPDRNLRQVLAFQFRRGWPIQTLSQSRPATTRRPARACARSGTARDRPATNCPCRPAVHPPTRRSRHGESAPHGASPSILGRCRPPIPHNRYRRPGGFRPRRGSQTVPLPPVPSRRDRVLAGSIRVRDLPAPPPGPRTGTVRSPRRRPETPHAHLPSRHLSGNRIHCRAPYALFLPVNYIPELPFCQDLGVLIVPGSLVSPYVDCL